MRKLSRIQLMGPLALFAVVLAAEAGSYALARNPSSAFLWYLNLDVFGVFRKSRLLLGEWSGVPFAQLALVTPLALAALAGSVWRQRFMTAMATNLSFIYAVFLAYSWEFWRFAGQIPQASLLPLAVPAGNDLYLFLTLGSAAMLSLAASHIVYFRAVRSRG